MLMSFFPLKQRSLFSITWPSKLLAELRLQFSHLNAQKSRHNFKDCVSPICDCGAETETTCHFFLCCLIFAKEIFAKTPWWYLSVDASIKSLNEESLIEVLLYLSNRYNGSKNKEILLHTICYIQSTKRFERPLIDQY